MTLRVVLDATPIRPRMKGLGRFLRGLIDEMAKDPPAWLDKIFIDFSYASQAKARWPKLQIVAVDAYPAILWEQRRLPSLLRRDQDAVLLTASDRVPTTLANRTVMYLFEIPDYRVASGRREGDGWYSRLSGFYNLWSFRRAVAKLKGLIVSSEATGRDLVAHYGLSRADIQVVYAAIDEQFFKTSVPYAVDVWRQKLTGGKPYVLHFSTGDPRDNSGVALRAFAIACRTLPENVVLLIAGTNAKGRAALCAEVEQLAIASRVVIVPFLDEDDLPLLYAGADAYVDPTLYEGFGLQVAEAMACGVPIIASDTTSVPEVAGRAALLYSPHDIEGFACGLERVFSDVQLRTELVAQGKRRAITFTWPKTVSSISKTLMRATAVTEVAG